MIPKRIFFYWSGNNMSWMRYMTLFSCRKKNPNWEIILYLSDNNNSSRWNGPEEQDYFTYAGINYLDKVEELNIKIEKVEWPDELREKFKDMSPVHESDLFRYYELYRNGGIYCDMDVLFFRSLDNFYNEITKGNYDTILHQTNEYLSIGFLGSSIDNKFYKDLFNFGLSTFNMNNYQSMGVDLMYNMFNGNRTMGYILNKMIIKYDTLKWYSIPNSLIYYFDWTKVDYNFTNTIYTNKFPIDSVGYHWFGGNKISQYYNNILNEENYKNYKTTFSVIAKKILE
jgi:hypothetical protein